MSIRSLAAPLAAFSLVFFAASLTAQDDDAVFSVVYQDGKSSRVSVESLDGTTVRLKARVLGGTMIVTDDLGEFQPASQLRILEAANPPEDFDGHFALARKAAELGILGKAGSEARAALKTVEGTGEEEAKTAEVRSWAAGALEKMIEDALAQDDLKQAQHCLKLLTTRLADQRTEEQLDAYADKVEALEQGRREVARNAREAKLDAVKRKDLDARLRPIRGRVELGDKRLGEAMRKSSKPTESANLAEGAIAAYKSSWQDLQKLQGQNGDDAQFAEEAEAMASHIHDNAIRAALHAANVLTVRSDYKGAMDWANRVLAFEPDNAEAKEMVRTIQIAAAAASAEWGWGWRTVGGVDMRRQ